MAITKTIEDMHRLAASRGGLCLSATYVRGSDRLEWQCAQGHRWSATPDSVKQRSWCPTCSRVRKLDTLEAMHAVAARRGGRCLSQHYAGCSTPLEWECAQGHRWQAVPASVKRRTWCPECARQQRKGYTLDDMHALATARGGLCLSTAYISGAQPLQWRCARGHEWHAAPVGIRRGAWCRQCYYDSMRGSLADMQALAESRGGRCLSTRYADAHTPLRWQCAQGHTWEAVPHSVADGRWCRQCASQNVHASTIEQMHELARSRGGKCLSAQYLGIVALLAWQCACGHVWRSRPKTVLGGGWCPACLRRSRYAYSIQDMQELAHSRGGKCLSKEYLGVAVKLAWECQRGHEWTTKPEIVMAGHWCPQCANLERIRPGNDWKRRRYEATGKQPDLASTRTSGTP
ncbi:conserved hypothetical protein [Paraburkholderia unamae]|uniref:hypothetical protein n=1 Tax=Paraburkholderia unamae TaxID=219649 RepID=UPI001CB1B59F|nr:hypothetical protein [Paraburkholderia unamae]CAG9246552.1 conserved hypothetical protein [Paraburkholderia unamae]